MRLPLHCHPWHPYLVVALALASASCGDAGHSSSTADPPPAREDASDAKRDRLSDGGGGRKADAAPEAGGLVLQDAALPELDATDPEAVVDAGPPLDLCDQAALDARRSPASGRHYGPCTTVRDTNDDCLADVTETTDWTQDGCIMAMSEDPYESECYDELGRKVSSFTCCSWDTTTYAENGRVASICHSEDLGGNDYCSSWTYNNDGDLIRETGDGFEAEYTYSYDAAGRAVSRDGIDEEGTLFERVLYEYDAAGRRLARVDEDLDGVGDRLVEARKTLPNGGRSVETVTYYDWIDGRTTYDTEVTDAAGRVVMRLREQRDAAGAVTSSVLDHWELDAMGNVLALEHGEPGRLSRTSYRLDQFGNRLASYTVRANGSESRAAFFYECW